MFATAILGGLRKGELCGLQKPDVDLARRLLLVRRCYARPFPKNRKQRSAPPAEEEAGTPRIFPSDSGLITGGEYGTRTRGLRRDRPAL